MFNHFVLEKLTDTVYEHNAINGVNVAGIQTIDCQILFGSAAEATQDGGYCRCVDDAVAFFDANKCCMFQIQMILFVFEIKIFFFPDFLVETPLPQSNTASDCPPTSEVIF
jgi:hypothetical protein